MPEFYTIIARKIFSRILGGTCSLSFPCPRPMTIKMATSGAVIKSAWIHVCRILDEGMQQQKVTPEFQRPSSATFPAKPFNEKQATIVGYVLIVIGCLSFFFNSIDLAIGTGLPAVSRTTTFQNTDDSDFVSLSHISLGVAGHGLWCGILVSTRSSHPTFAWKPSNDEGQRHKPSI